MPHLVCQKHIVYCVVQEDLFVYILKKQSPRKKSGS